MLSSRIERLLPIDASCVASPPSLSALSRCLPPRPAADRSWAQPQIKTVVEAGLLADTVAAFKPQRPLTQRALGAALETLVAARVRSRSSTAIASSCPAARSRSASSTRRSSAFSGSAMPPARSPPRSATPASAPKAGAGTETVARLLGLRFNHPAGQRHARARPERSGDARRGRVLAGPRSSTSPAGSRTRFAPRPRRSFLPELTELAAPACSARRLVRRLPVRLGRHVGSAAAAAREAGARRLRLLRVHLARVQARAVRRRLRARDRPARPHDVRDVGRGAARPADQEAWRTSSRAT